MSEFSPEYIITIIGVIVAGITIFLVDCRMKESNKITRDVLQVAIHSNQLELIKNKPKLVLEHASYELDEQEDMIEFTAKLTNNGEIPISNIRYEIEITNFPFGIEHFKIDTLTDNDFSLANHLPTLAKDETHTIQETQTFRFKTQLICVGLWVRYDFLDEKDHQEIFFHYFQKGVSPHVHYTLHHEDLKRVVNNRICMR